MNFKTEFLKGQNKANKGIVVKDIEGLGSISDVINGIQKAKIYAIAAAPKVGKTTLTDAFFILGVYLTYLKNPFPIEWIYFSFEITRIEKEFEFATFFLYYDYNIETVNLPKNVFKSGKNTIDINSNYLMGRLTDDNGEVILIDEYVKECLKSVYRNRIIPLFGNYDEQGLQLSKGLITFIKDRDNPTGLKRFLENYAEENGTFVKSNVYSNNRISNYIPNDPDKFTIIITDHLRRIHPEQNLSIKNTVDKYSSMTCDLRDWCKFTFVHVIHMNRSFAEIDNIKFFKDKLYPTSENIKDTGNISEDANYVFTMMNPNDEKYNLKSHFGIKLKDEKNNLIHPNMRTLHLVESRDTFYPQHFAFNMISNLKYFRKLKNN